MSKDIASPNGLMTIARVQTTRCSIDDCTKRIRKGSDLCAGHYRLAQDDESEVRHSAYAQAWNTALEVATEAIEGKDDKGTSPYVIRTTKATSGFAYFLANNAGLEVFKPQAYGKARTFGLEAPSDRFVRTFVKALNKSDIAKSEKVTFDALKVVW